MTWVYVAMRSIDATHFDLIRTKHQTSKRTDTIVVSSRDALLKAYGPTLAVRGALFFHFITADGAASDDDDDDDDDSSRDDSSQPSASATAEVGSKRKHP
jgi:hypothetical protein